MLVSLYIKNYALIDETTINFDKGFTIITGETGAGKSIILGAIGLVLGNRADHNALKNQQEKCIIEATFELGNDFVSFFQSQDLDYENITIIRREVLSNGKTRAFINDTPVNLSVLSDLGNLLIDIHSQHQTHELVADSFQFELLDAFSNQQSKIIEYRECWLKLKNLEKKIKEINEELLKELKERDYTLFLLTELEEARLNLDEQYENEQLLKQLTHAEQIIEKLQFCLHLSNNDEIGLISQLKSFKTSLSKISEYSDVYSNLNQRIESIWIEFSDIIDEVETESEKIHYNPEMIQHIQQRLDLIYQLHQKHQTNSIKELLQIQSHLKDRSSKNAEMELELQKFEVDREKVLNHLYSICKVVSKSRISIAPKLVQQLKLGLHQLGMPDADFKIEINQSDSFNHFGKDQIQILFSGNKGGQFAPLRRVASGGELSRIMFTVKSLLAKYQQLPTIIFDEIDTGVSGEIADKMAQMMRELSEYTQVISITHLPQIAAKGHQHYKVFKTTNSLNTVSEIKKLSQQERIIEIAQMVSGAEISETAIVHAKALLN